VNCAWQKEGIKKIINKNKSLLISNVPCSFKRRTAPATEPALQLLKLAFAPWAYTWVKARKAYLRRAVNIGMAGDSTSIATTSGHNLFHFRSLQHLFNTV
jgi:hypothetical protein